MREEDREKGRNGEQNERKVQGRVEALGRPEVVLVNKLNRWQTSDDWPIVWALWVNVEFIQKIFQKNGKANCIPPMIKLSVPPTIIFRSLTLHLFLRLDGNPFAVNFGVIIWKMGLTRSTHFRPSTLTMQRRLLGMTRATGECSHLGPPSLAQRFQQGTSTVALQKEERFLKKSMRKNINIRKCHQIKAAGDEEKFTFPLGKFP